MARMCRGCFKTNRPHRRAGGSIPVGAGRSRTPPHAALCSTKNTEERRLKATLPRPYWVFCFICVVSVPSMSRRNSSWSRRRPSTASVKTATGMLVAITDAKASVTRPSSPVRAATCRCIAALDACSSAICAVRCARAQPVSALSSPRDFVSHGGQRARTMPSWRSMTVARWPNAQPSACAASACRSTTALHPSLHGIETGSAPVSAAV